MGSSIHFYIKCESCKRQIGGCRCPGADKTIRYADPATCYHCTLKEKDDLFNREPKKRGRPKGRSRD